MNLKDIEKLIQHPSFKDNKFVKVHFDVAVKKANDQLAKK